jgi:hypothetical protein
VVGEGCWRMLRGDEGLPHGVSTSSVAASVKPGRDEIPVPPMTAMCTGAMRRVSGDCEGRDKVVAYRRRCWERQPFCDMELRWNARRCEVAKLK